MRIHHPSPKPATIEDHIALVEACCEQGMELKEVIDEMRRFEYDSLRATVDLLRSVVAKSKNPAVDALRARVASLGQYTTAS